MSKNNFLLFIDRYPVDPTLKSYFMQFNINIKHCKSVNSISLKNKLPIAILINYHATNKNIEIIHKLRVNYSIPLIIINDVIDDELCIKVLNAGADDFVIKTISARELHARISAITRRVSRIQNCKSTEILTFKNWELYPASRTVFCIETQKELLLSAGEYNLLYTFVQQPLKVLARELLVHSSKNIYLNPFDRRIDVQISRLRQKIEKDGKNPILIKTIRNGGYMLTCKVRLSKK